MIIQGDCKEKLKELEDNSVDAVVTDPPAGISFMGKDWDKDKGGKDEWIAWMQEIATECKRVLKPGGHAFVWAIPRTSHWTATAWENAGFDVRDIVAHVFGSGFPKSLSVGKAINKLETNEWSKISKALDNIDQKSIMEEWNTNSNNVKIVDRLSEKSQTEIGICIPRSVFVQESVVENINQENSNLLVSFAEKNLNEAQVTNTKINTVLQNVEAEIKQLQNNVKSAEKKSQDQNHNLSMSIFTVAEDVKEWLNENTEVNHKVDEVLKTLRGNKKYSNEEITNVICAVLTNALKLTILNQSKTFQGLDTKSKMDYASAINVIITEYTAENLILNTIAILKSKAVDKIQGNEREVTGTQKLGGTAATLKGSANRKDWYDQGKGGAYTPEIQITKGTSPWEGWGTALKPAREDWILLRKPPEKGLSIAQNVLKYGTGGLNIDKSRVGTEQIENGREGRQVADSTSYHDGLKPTERNMVTGRFPANLLHDGSDEVVREFPNSKTTANPNYKWDKTECDGNTFTGRGTYTPRSDSGSSARFFKSFYYVAKASKRERDRGCEGLEAKRQWASEKREASSFDIFQNGKPPMVAKNNHPTVKPLALMKYLIQMITPEGGVVLDPFAGSGSTLVAAKELGYDFIGIEMTEEYIPIIEARLNAVRERLL